MNAWAGLLRSALAAGVLVVAGLMPPVGAALGVSALDESKIKREAVFDFAQPPRVTRTGDRVTVGFETKGYCDVTVAIEDGRGDGASSAADPDAEPVPASPGPATTAAMTAVTTRVPIRLPVRSPQ
jgi:hypothetical protein